MNIRDRVYIATFSDNGINLAKEYELGIEINHTCISSALDDTNKLISDIKSEIGDYDKLIVHGPFTEIHPAAIDYKVRDLGLERLNSSYEVVKSLNASKMVVHTGWLPFIYFKSYQEEEAAKFFSKFMENKDMILAIENVLEDEPYTLKNMMDKIENPNIKLCIDIGHLNAMKKEGDVYTWIDTLSKYITHLHLHNNYSDNDSHNNFYDGDMDIERVIKYIENKCENVTYTIESRDAKGSIDYLLEKGII